MLGAVVARDLPDVAAVIQDVFQRVVTEIEFSSFGTGFRVSPSAFLRDVARPALLEGAASSGRPRPRLVGHAFGLVSDDAKAVKKLGRERLVGYTGLAFYQAMFAAAGYPEARDGVVSDDLVDDLVLAGKEERVADGVRRFFDRGADELIVRLLPGSESDVERTFRLLGATT